MKEIKDESGECPYCQTNFNNLIIDEHKDQCKY